MQRSFQIALAFLTVFKSRIDPSPDMAEVGASAWAFPLVGAILGIILVLAGSVLSVFLPVLPAAVLLVALWVVLTGGLHLDGWTDCWDALAASVPAERRFEILKDSRLGTFGALALILLIALKIGAVGSGHVPTLLLFLAPVIGRATMVVASPGGLHRGDGMAAQFLSGLDPRIVRWAAVLGFAPALLAGWKGALAVAVAYVGALWFRRFAEFRLQTFNGDVIGAMGEFSEVLVLLAACVRW
jgi:adenosylcobinamide-GDP ribazoletransferase